ncbi:MAG TPA: hypothetical protein DCS93_36600 [Microscillaceae bacterium]|nr:hypothetical protein [Microscillaceae bacterium]
MTLSNLLNNTTTKRDALKLAFNVGQVPTQQNFHEMIDGLFQIQGTTLYKDDNSGLGIQAGTDPTKPVLNLYDDPAQAPVWSVGIQNGLEIKDATSVTRLTVANDGNVGVGTTSPTSTLEVYAAPGNTATGMVISQGNDGGNTNSGCLFFHNASDPGNAFTIVKTLNRLSFMSNATPGTNSGTERISLTNQGNVGIGINVPQSKLEIQQNQVYTNAHEANALVVRTPTAPSPNDGRMVGISLTIGESADVHDVNQKSASIFAQSTNQYANIVDMLFYTRGSSSPYYSEKMRVTGNGNIGIGTDGPEAALDINVPPNTYDKLLQFRRGSGRVRFLMNNNTHDLYITTGTSSPTNGLYIGSNGYIGIGTASPQAKFHIHANPRENLRVYSTESGAAGKYLNMWQGTGAAVVDAIGSSALIIGYDNPTINLGIGTLTPSERLHVNGNIRIQNTGTGYENNSGYLYLHSVDGDYARIFSEKVADNQIRLVLETGDDGNTDYMVVRNRIWNEPIGFDAFEVHRTWARVNGDLYVTGSINPPSDIRFKKNIQTLDESFSANLFQLQGKSYEFRVDEFKEKGFKEGRHMGFIASELQEFFPHLVSEDDKGYLAINYTGLIPIIVEANKQQERRIEALEAKLAKFMNQ